MILDKYGFLLFDARIQQPDCLLFSDIVLEIYDSLDLGTIAPAHLQAVLNYLFSLNGLLAPQGEIKQKAALLFLRWYKDNKHQKEAMMPFVEQFLNHLAPQIISKVTHFKNAGQFGKIFEILGTMLCDQGVSLEARCEYSSKYLQILHDKIVTISDRDQLSSCLTALHYI